MKKMNRVMSVLLVLAMTLSLAGCGGAKESTPAETAAPGTEAPASAAEPTAASTEAPTEAPTEPETEAPEPVVYEKTATGTQGMVAAADPAAAQVGIDMLKAGGNAMDAAIATAFALGVVENAASGIGGSGLMMYYDASTGKTTAIDYYYQCPAAMNLSDFVDDKDPKTYGMGGLQAIVPGFVAGMEKACEMFGTKSFAELIEPAAQLAEKGAPVSEFMAETYMNAHKKMMLYPETARVFTYDGFPYFEGEIFKNPDLAKTYRLIAEKGSEVFYKGEIAEEIVSSLRLTGGKVTMEDLANYHVVVREPLMTTYRGYQVYIMPPVSGGAVSLAALNLAEHFDIGSLEFGSVEYLHTWGEIFHVAWGDFSTSLEDPDFADMSRVRGMITKEYADERVKLIDMNKTWDIGPVGNPESYDPESHTTHLSVIDKDGNMVSMTNTNSDFFGSLTTVKGYGFIVQNTGSFSASLSSYAPEPGKRARTTMAPAIVLTPEGKPYAAIGTPGSQRIMTTVPLIISHLIDYGTDLETALARPRLYQGRNENLNLEGGFDKSVEEKLKALGHGITWHVANDSYFGGAHCIVIDQTTGVMTGCADVRRSGAAIGY